MSLKKLIEKTKMNRLYQEINDKWYACGSWGYGSETGIGNTIEEALTNLLKELKEANKK